MPAVRKSRRSVEEQVRTELQQIRVQVAGVRGSLVATSDGLVVAHDIPDVEPTQIAALAAATLAVARRATLATECGTFREAVARGSDGYLAVYAGWKQRDRGRHRDQQPERRNAAVPGARDHRTDSRELQPDRGAGRARPAGERRFRQDQPFAAQAPAGCLVLAEPAQSVQDPPEQFGLSGREVVAGRHVGGPDRRAHQGLVLPRLRHPLRQVSPGRREHRGRREHLRLEPLGQRPGWFGRLRGRIRPPGSGGRRTRSPRTAPGHRSRPNLGPNGRRRSRTRRPTAPG